MASTYSGNLNIELIGTGDQAGTWGATTNVNLGTALEQSIVGSSNVSFTSGANTAIAITQSNAYQAARSLRLNLTGTVAATQYLFVPAINKQYVVNNGLGSPVIVANGGNTGATGATVKIPANTTAVVYNDGTNVAPVMTSLPISTTYTMKLPTADGTSGQTLITDGAGNLSFTAPGITTGKSIAMALIFGF